jgi:RNA polymerase I-specific transcription initiation factor RRN3
MENIIRIDVYIQEKLEDLSEEQIENVQDMLFTMEEEEENEDSDSDIGVDRTIQANYQEMFIKLDELMLLVLNYIGNLSGVIKQHETESPLEKTFFALMDCFERLIVPTHRIKCAQFVLFYICSLDTKFSEHLLSFLLASLLSDNLSSVIGLSITAYMGSFVSRAKYIPISAVKKSLEILNQYCSRYIGKNDFNSSKLNPDTHATFYGAVQAILYIFCFKWKELCGTEPNQIGTFPAELAGFHLVLMSKLEPLKVFMI